MKHARLTATLFAVLAALSVTPLPAEPGHPFPPLTAEEIHDIHNALTTVSARATPTTPRRLLVFYRTEGFVHASIPNANEALRLMGEKTGAYTLTLSDDMSVFTPATLAAYDAILFCNTTQLAFSDTAQRQALLDYVHSGKGLIGLHAASDNFPKWPEGQALMGGVFHGHPWTSGQTVAVKNDDPDHILNTAFAKRGFWITEEIYQINGPYSRERQRVLLSLDMSRSENVRPADKIFRTDNDFPISWLKTEGKGRVFYTSLGHNKNIFAVPAILQHILDGIQYALGDLKADAVPSATLSPQPKPALAPDDHTTLQQLAGIAKIARQSHSAAPGNLNTLATYNYGAPLTPQIAYEDYLRKATPEQRATVEAEILTLLEKTATTLAAKRIFLAWLGWIGTEKSIPAISKAATNPELAHAATRSLAAINTPKADAALDALIADSGILNATPQITIEALNAAAQRGSETATLDIATLIENKNATVSEAALEALAHISKPEAIRALVETNRKQPDNLAITRALIAATKNGQRHIPAEAISEYKEDAARLYASILGSTNNPIARIEAAQALVTIDPTNTVLLTFLNNPDTRLHTLIARGMVSSGNPDALKILVTRFPELPKDTQFALMTALIGKPNPDALALIKIALASTEADVQNAAITAAGRSGNETTIAPLLDAMDSENTEQADAAFAALTQLPDCDGKTNAILRQRLARGPKLLRILAARQNRETFSIAIAATTTTDNDLRLAAYEAIALLVRPDEFSKIIPLSANIKRPLERREWTKALYNTAATDTDTSSVIQALQKQIATASAADRPILIAALTMVPSPDAKAVLQNMLTSTDANVRKETIRALSSARSETAYAILVESARTAPDATERLLAQRGATDTVDQLTMTNKDRASAYRALWKTAETDESKEAIIAALKRQKNSETRALLQEIAPEGVQ